MFEAIKAPGNKVHFVSLGCPRNLVDTEVMLGILLQAGYEVTDQVPLADYLIVNTCSFLSESRKESLKTIEELLEAKKTEAKVVVTGCMVQKHKEEIVQAIPQVNYLLGSGDVSKILELIQSTQDKELISNAKSYLESGEIPRKISTPKHYAYLKIAEGCRKRCAFCIIPAIKGPLKSKPHEQILKEFHSLLNQGVHEIILIAQDLGDYGKDRGESEGLEELIKEMLKVKKEFWLRFLYLYPDEITDSLIELMKSDPRICHYVDMPIQHINSKILKSMRRKTSKDEIIHTITKLRQSIPDMIIRTSLMVGFPGETEEDFEELITFVKEHPLDHVGVFKFSAEPGASAASFPDQVSDEVKEARYHKLMQLQKKISQKRNKQWIGKKIPVVIDGYHPETNLLMIGRSYGHCPDIDGLIILNDTRKVEAIGKLHMVEITEVADYDLIGRVISVFQPNKPSKTSLGQKLDLFRN